MFIGMQIKKMRKTEMLTQLEFATRLGIKRSYVSELENGKYKPSEQLILSICREFGVQMEWLKYGHGQMYQLPSLTEKGVTLSKEICRRVVSPGRTIPLRHLALILGIDPDKSPRDKQLHRDFYIALILLIQIFEEGDGKKREAIIAQLNALKPYTTELPMVAEKRADYGKKSSA